jgi:hypothetical protein
VFTFWGEAELMATVYRPIDVLEKQVDLVRYWKSSQYRHGFIDSFQPMVDKYPAMRTQGKPWRLEEYLSTRLDSAETFYVRREIIARLWDFTDVYEAHEHEIILPQDLPCSYGFIYLERPIHILDARGRVTSVKAILWSEERDAVIISEFSDAYDELDEINLQEWAEIGSRQEVAAISSEIPLMHIMPWAWGAKVQNLTEEDMSDPVGLADLHGEVGDAEEYEKHKGSYAFSVNRFNSFLISLWEFVQEQIPYRMRADRFMLKRLKRAHSPLSEVTVVELRPVDRPPQFNDPDHVPQLVVWSHRWRVREHKRRWIDKHGNYRETTVSACVKGPEHLPLIEKDVVFHVRK